MTSSFLTSARITRIVAVFLWLFVYLWGVQNPQHYSEESIWNAPLSDPVFGGEYNTLRHVSDRHFNVTTGMKLLQRERFDGILGSLNAAISALNHIGLQVFLDSGTLLGWYRHGGMPIPWDFDADVGVLGEDCRRKFPTRASIQKAVASVLPPPYVVPFFDCNTQPGNRDGFAGMISDTRNGFKVDIFVYDPVDTSKDSFAWRKGRKWLQRDFLLDRLNPGRVTPFEAILPLQWGNFSGVSGNIIPNDPQAVLQWDFGRVLDAPIFPFALNLKVCMSVFSVLGITVLLLLTAFERVLFSITCAGAVTLLAGGPRVLAMLINILFLMRAERQKISPRKQSIIEFTRLATVASLLRDISILTPQVYATIMEALGVTGYVVNEGRWCFLYSLVCIDM